MGEVKYRDAEADELLARILYLLERRRFGEARSVLEKYTGLFPESAEGWVFTGFTNGALNNNTEAGEALAKAEQFAGLDAHIWFNIGVAYVRVKQKGKAKSAFKKAEKNDKYLKERIREAQKTEAPDLFIVVPERLQDLYRLQIETDDTPSLSKARAVHRRVKAKRTPEKTSPLSRKKLESKVDKALSDVERYTLKSSKGREKGLLKALEETDAALLILPGYFQAIERVTRLRLSIFLALDRYNDALKLYEQLGRPKAWGTRIVSIPHLFNLIRLFTEYGKESDIIKIYSSAQQTLMKHVLKHADANPDNHHLWNIMFLDCAWEKKAEEMRNVCEKIRDIGFEDPEKLWLLLKVFSEFKTRRFHAVGWMLYNQKEDALEFYWDLEIKESKLNKYPDDYVGWTNLGDKLKSEGNHGLAEECFNLAKRVGERATSRYAEPSEQLQKQISEKLTEAELIAIFEESGLIGKEIEDGTKISGGIKEMDDMVDEWLEAKKDRGRRRKTGLIGKTTVRCPKCMTVIMLFEDAKLQREAICQKCTTTISW
jgi:tetratricopeptide (TPR) repeat protein